MNENTQQPASTNGEYGVQIVGNDDIGRPIRGPIITGPSNGAAPTTDTAPPNGAGHDGVSAVIAPENKGGRPSKYEPETVNLLLAALADGLNQKQACLACGISENTLKTWREKYPDFEAAMTEARETARRKVLAMIKSIGEEDSDWRALDAWLQRSFPADYRRDSINVRAEANAAAGASTRYPWEPPTAQNPLTPEEIAQLQQAHKERMERIRKQHNKICEESGMEDLKI